MGVDYPIYTEGGVQQPGANAHTQPLNILPGCVIALILSNDRMGKMKNSLRSGLDLLKRPLNPCCSEGNFVLHVQLFQAMLKLEGLVDILSLSPRSHVDRVTSKGHVDNPGLFFHPRPS